MKIRFAVLLLAAALVFTLSGCGSASGDVSQSDIQKNMKDANDIKQKDPGTGGSHE